MARFSEAWNELLHPRDRLGRFRSKWSLKGAKKAQVDGILDRFEPRTFTDPNRAARYGIDESAGQTPLQKRSIRDYITRNFRAFNAELEQGKTSPETDAIDSAMKPLRDDLVLTRSTGPEAFGLNPNDAQAIEELTGKLIASDTYTPTWLAGGTNNGGIVMHILAPKGTPAIFPGGAEVTIARGQPFRVTKVEKDPATGRMRMFAIALPKGSENGEKVETNLPEAIRGGREGANVEAMQRSARFPDQPAVPTETIPEPLPPSTEPAPERLAPNPRAGEIQPPKAAPSITGDTPGGVEEDGRPSWTSGNNPIEVQAPGGGAGLRVTAGNKVVVPDSADMEVLAVNAARAGLPEVAGWAKANQRRVKMSDAPASAQRAAKRAVAARDLRANEEPDAPEASAPKAATPSAPETAAATPAPPASTQAAPQAAPTLEAPQAARAPGATQAVPAAPEVPEAAPQVVPAAPEVPEAAPQAVPAPEAPQVVPAAPEVPEAAPQAVPAPEAPQVVPQATPAPRAAPAPEAPRAVPEAAAPALPVARTEPAPEAVPEAAPGVPEAAPSLLSGPEAAPPVATQLPTVAPIPASVPPVQPVTPEAVLPSAPEVPTPAQVDITQPVPANATPEYRAAHFKALQEAARAARAQQDENQTPRADEETAKPEPVVVAPVKKVVKKAATKKAAPVAAESAPEAAEQIPLAKSTARAVRKTTPAQLRDRADAAGIDVPASARTKPEILDAIVKGVLEHQGVEKPEAKKAQPTKITARKIAKTPIETPEDREKKVIEAATTKQVGSARKIAKPATETPQARVKALSDQQAQEAADDRLNGEQRKRWADALGGEPKNLTAGDVLLDEMADELRNGRITRAKAATRLREHTRDDDTPEAHYLRKVADLIESDTSKPAKRVPRTKRPAKPEPDIEAVETSLIGRTERNIQTGMNNLNVAELRALADKWGIETRGDDKKLKLKGVLSKELAAKWKATPELQRKKEGSEALAPARKVAAPVKKAASEAPEVAATRALRQPAKKAAKKAAPGITGREERAQRRRVEAATPETEERKQVPSIRTPRNPRVTTTSEKATAKSLTPGTRILVTRGEDGEWRPATKKTDATVLTVTRKDSLSGPGARVAIRGTGPDGEEITISRGTGSRIDRDGLVGNQTFIKADAEPSSTPGLAKQLDEAAGKLQTPATKKAVEKLSVEDRKAAKAAASSPESVTARRAAQREALKAERIQAKEATPAESSPADELDGMSKVQLLQYARDNDLKVPVSKSVAETRQRVKRARDAKENSRKLVETAKGSVKAVEPEPEAPQQPIKKAVPPKAHKKLSPGERVAAALIQRIGESNPELRDAILVDIPAEDRAKILDAIDRIDTERSSEKAAKKARISDPSPRPIAIPEASKRTTQRVSPKRLTGSEIVDSSPEEIAQAHSEGRVSSTLAVRRIRQDAAASKTSASFIGLGKPDKELDRSQLQDRQAHLKRAAELDALADRIQGTPRKRASKKAAPSVESIAPEVKTETVDAETAQIPEAPVEVKAPPVAKKATPKKMTVRDIASASPEDLVRGVDDGHVSHARAIQELQIRNSSLTDDVTRGDLTDDPERSATRDELKRNQEALKELRGAPAAKKVQAKKAAPSPVDLAGAESREQAEKMLTDLSAEQLREISREMGIPPQSRATKEKLRRDIVDNAVGMRIDANAIMGRAPEEREANRQQGAKKARARMAETSPAVSPAKTVKTTVLSKATKKAAGPAAPVPPSTPLPSAPAKVVSPAIRKEAKDAAASEDAAPKVATSTGGPIVPGPPVKGAGNSVTTSRGEIVSRNRPKADEPIFLPNGGLDQGLIHLDSELGSLWADLYVDDREPNSFINEIARMGDAMGMGQLGLSDFIARLKEMKKKATDKAVADRIQSAIDRVDAPPVKLDIPDDTPPRLRQAFEELAAIPTARKSGPVRMGTTLLRAGDPSVLDRKQDILRRFISGSDPELLRPGAARRELGKHDLHEGTDAATTMWRIFDTALKDPAVERWLNDKVKAGRLKNREAGGTPPSPAMPPSPAPVETPSIQRHTRSQLMALNPGELKEIEDELGITKRPSLDRGDRADAILKAEAAQAARKAASSNK